MKNIRCLSKYNSLKANKKIILYSAGIIKRHSVNIKNFLGFIDLFYKIDADGVDLEDFYNKIQLQLNILKREKKNELKHDEIKYNTTNKLFYTNVLNKEESEEVDSEKNEVKSIIRADVDNNNEENKNQFIEFDFRIDEEAILNKNKIIKGIFENIKAVLIQKNYIDNKKNEGRYNRYSFDSTYQMDKTQYAISRYFDEEYLENNKLPFLEKKILLNTISTKDNFTRTVQYYKELFNERFNLSEENNIEVWNKHVDNINQYRKTVFRNERILKEIKSSNINNHFDYFRDNNNTYKEQYNFFYHNSQNEKILERKVLSKKEKEIFIREKFYRKGYSKDSNALDSFESGDHKKSLENYNSILNQKYFFTSSEKKDIFNNNEKNTLTSEILRKTIENIFFSNHINKSIFNDSVNKVDFSNYNWESRFTKTNTQISIEKRNEFLKNLFFKKDFNNIKNSWKWQENASFYKRNNIKVLVDKHVINESDQNIDFYQLSEALYKKNKIDKTQFIQNIVNTYSSEFNSEYAPVTHKNLFNNEVWRNKEGNLLNFYEFIKNEWFTLFGDNSQNYRKYFTEKIQKNNSLIIHNFKGKNEKSSRIIRQWDKIIRNTFKRNTFVQRDKYINNYETNKVVAQTKEYLNDENINYKFLENKFGRRQLFKTEIIKNYYRKKINEIKRNIFAKKEIDEEEIKFIRDSVQEMQNWKVYKDDKLFLQMFRNLNENQKFDFYREFFRNISQENIRGYEIYNKHFKNTLKFISHENANTRKDIKEFFIHNDNGEYSKKEFNERLIFNNRNFNTSFHDIDNLYKIINENIDLKKDYFKPNNVEEIKGIFLGDKNEKKLNILKSTLENRVLKNIYENNLYNSSSLSLNNIHIKKSEDKNEYVNNLFDLKQEKEKKFRIRDLQNINKKINETLHKNIFIDSERILSLLESKKIIEQKSNFFKIFGGTKLNKKVSYLRGDKDRDNYFELDRSKKIERYYRKDRTEANYIERVLDEVNSEKIKNINHIKTAKEKDTIDISMLKKEFKNYYRGEIAKELKLERKVGENTVGRESSNRFWVEKIFKNVEGISPKRFFNRKKIISPALLESIYKANEINTFLNEQNVLNENIYSWKDLRYLQNRSYDGDEYTNNLNNYLQNFSEKYYRKSPVSRIKDIEKSFKIDKQISNTLKLLREKKGNNVPVSRELLKLWNHEIEKENKGYPNSYFSEKNIYNKFKHIKNINNNNDDYSSEKNITKNILKISKQNVFNLLRKLGDVKSRSIKNRYNLFRRNIGSTFLNREFMNHINEENGVALGDIHHMKSDNRTNNLEELNLRKDIFNMNKLRNMENHITESVNKNIRKHNNISKILYRVNMDNILSEEKIIDKNNIKRNFMENAIHKANLKEYMNNYNNHTFKQKKNEILNNNSEIKEVDYNHITDIIFKQKEQGIDKSEIIKLIGDQQKNLQVEMQNIVNNSIRKNDNKINITNISAQVYKEIENKMRHERRRKGMI